MRSEGFINLGLLIGAVVACVLGIGASAAYFNVFPVIEEADILMEGGVYDVVETKLEDAQNNWVIRVLGLGRGEINARIERNKRLLEDSTKYEEALDGIKESDLSGARNLLSNISQGFIRYDEVQEKLREVEDKLVEIRISEAVGEVERQAGWEIAEVRKETEAERGAFEVTREVKNSKQDTALSNDHAPTISDIVGHWRFFTAKVECGDGWGSGFVTKGADGNIKVLTNKHVVESSSLCEIRMPGDLFHPINRKQIYRGVKDFAVIYVDNSSEYLSDLIAGDAYVGICAENEKPVLGDEILILGYPRAGSPTDVTVTKGIISGFERPYLITDAKINPGNSGGVAIHIEKNCYFGIPTGSLTADNKRIFEAMGRILDIWEVIGEF